MDNMFNDIFNPVTRLHVFFVHLLHFESAQMIKLDQSSKCTENKVKIISDISKYPK